MRRWPQWRLDDGTTAMFQAQGGLADPFKGNAAHLRLATERGATLQDRTPVTAIRQVGGEVEVDAGGTTHRAAHVVVAADAWTNELLAPFGRRLPLTITKEQVTYLAAPDPAAFAPDRFPVWIWMDDPSFYGFPTYGEAGPKAAQDCGGQPTTPETRTFERDEAAHARVGDFLAAHLPGAVGPDIYTKTCLYTLTPDRDFVVDRLPEAPGVTVLLGAAHGFKFASVLGRVAAELAFDGETPSAPDLERFRIDRPILLEAPRRRPGWSRCAWCVPVACTCPAACATVPPLEAVTASAVRGGYGPRWRRFECEFPCARGWHESSAPGPSTAALLLPARHRPRPHPSRAPGRHDPGPRLAQPVSPRSWSSATRPSGSTTTTGRRSVRTSSRSPGFADTWERAADGHSWTFHIRDGMKWSDGEPATVGGRLLHVAARRRRHQGARSPSAPATSSRRCRTPG